MTGSISINKINCLTMGFACGYDQPGQSPSFWLICQFFALVFFKSDLADNDIEHINNVELKFSFINKNLEEIYVSEPINIEFNK